MEWGTTGVIRRAARWCSAEPAIGLAYVAVGAAVAQLILLPHGNYFNQDSLRDYFQGEGILHGRIPQEGPAAGKLGISLSLFWPLLIASILTISRTPAWIAAFSVLWFGLATLLAARLAEHTLGRGAGPVGAAAFVSSTAITSAVPLFTHSAFILPFTTGGLLALMHSLGARRPGAAYVWAAGLLAAAGQLHASAFPLLALLLFRLWGAPDVSWRSACLAAAAFLFSFVPWGFDDPRLAAEWEARGLAAALLGWLEQNTALLPALAAVIVLGRPSLLRRRDSRRVLAGIGGAWAAWIVAERWMGDAWPVVKLFNLQFLRPPVLDDPAGANAMANLFQGLRLIIQPFGVRGHPIAELITLGALLWGLGCLIRRALDRADSQRLGARMILAGLVITVPPAVVSELRAPNFQPQYLQHVALLASLAVAAGLVAGASLLGRRLSARFALSRWNAGRLLGRERLVAGAILAFLSAALSPVAAPALVAVSGQTGVTPLLVPLVGWLRAGAIRSSADELGYARLLRAVIDDAGVRFGSFEALRGRVHGASSSIAFAEETESSWLLEACYAAPLPPPSQPAGARSHEIVFSRESPLSAMPGARSVAGTDLELRRFETTLDFSRARLAVTPAGGATKEWDVELPFSRRERHSAGACKLGNRTAIVGEMVNPVAWRVTIPRFAEAPARVLTVLLKESDRGSQCAVSATLNGAALPGRGQFGVGVRWLSFDLPATREPSVVSVELPACRVSHLDVFDPDGA